MIAAPAPELVVDEAVCRSCGAPITWAITSKGKRMPLDLEPVVEGRVLLQPVLFGGPPVARVLPDAELQAMRAQHAARVVAGEATGPFRLYISHFATCPHAHRWRRAATAA